MLTSFSKTHIGQRTKNEDFILIDKKLGLYIVADGVGELGNGDLASKRACKTIRKCVKRKNELKYSVFQAHGALVDYIESKSRIKDMATTVAAVLFKGNNYQISWVGDSRVYLWDGKLRLLTRDDSHVESYLDNGLIGVDDLATHPDRNYITQALGMRRREVTVHSNSGTLEKNQVLLICSDGLYNIANEAEIINELNHNESMTQLTEKLVDIAVNNNGIDNISLISVKSNENSSQLEEPIKPDIVREFDPNSGKIKNNTPVSDHKDVNRDLIDITKLQELTQQEKALLESAAKRTPEPEETSNYKLPIALVVIFIFIATLVYFLI